MTLSKRLWPSKRRRLLILAVLLAASAAGCASLFGRTQSPAAPTPLPTLAPTPSAPPTAVPTMAATPIPPADFNLVLPANWRTEVLDSAAAAPVLEDALRGLVLTPTSTISIEASVNLKVVVAWPEETQDAGLVALSLESHGLRLPALLDALSAQLRGAADVSVRDQGFDSALRDELPVAFVRYDTAGQAFMQWLVAGVQSGRLLVLTFYAAPANMDAFMPVMRDIVAAVEFQ